MAVCVGCGLIDDGDGNVSVATSGTFGMTTELTTFGSDDSVGAPIYCSDAGTLRTAPEHTSNAVAASGNSAVGAAYGASAVATGPTVATTIANPSATRSASLLIIYAVKWQVAVTTPGVALLANIVAGGTVIGDIGKYLGYPGVYTTEEYIGESYAATIAPGASYTFSVTPRADPAAGPGVGRLTAQGVGIRAIVVTQ